MQDTVTIRSESWDAPDGAALRTAQRVELDARYGCDDHEPGSAPTAADVATFLVARDGSGTALGCGGLRLLDAGCADRKCKAEIKRMYVAPTARGTGVATAVLRALEDAARTLGVTELVLETGTAQPDAIRFYEREGYRRIENFGAYLGSAISVCYGRTL
ncbi:GNAT family N-acetyltransferase [Pseudonocardia sp. GCM10023141]|uniref:GNAT family N-acetyltransferase n=1 Tax=Pseudonocardia sp. GCM10023141 TaxID=3252653 RepID=UPI00360C6387